MFSSYDPALCHLYLISLNMQAIFDVHNDGIDSGNYCKYVAEFRTRICYQKITQVIFVTADLLVLEKVDISLRSSIIIIKIAL